MNKRSPFHGNIQYEWERDEQSGPITITVCYESPAEGGDCELWGFELLPECPASKSIASQFEDAIETNDSLRAAVEESCRDDAANRCEPLEEF